MLYYIARFKSVSESAQHQCQTNVYYKVVDSSRGYSTLLVDGARQEVVRSTALTILNPNDVDDARAAFGNMPLEQFLNLPFSELRRVLEGEGEDELAGSKVKSDGSTAAYYELPKDDPKQLQDLISFRNMNGQVAEIFRACYRYGEVEHSEKLRDAKKMRFYADAEVKRLEKYGE